MANPAYVQSAGTPLNGSSNTISVTLGNTTAGNCIVVMGICGDAGVTISSVGDGGDSFASGVNLINDSTSGIVISYSYAVNIAALTTPTITITWSTFVNFGYILVWEISGTVTTGSPISVSQSAVLDPPSTSTNPTVNITPAVTGEMIIAAMAGATGGNTVSLGSGYTNLVGQAADTDEIVGENKANASAVSQAANFTLSGADSWGIVALSIKTTGSTPAPNLADSDLMLQSPTPISHLPSLQENDNATLIPFTGLPNWNVLTAAWEMLWDENEYPQTLPVSRLVEYEDHSIFINIQFNLLVNDAVFSSPTLVAIPYGGASVNITLRDNQYGSTAWTISVNGGFVVVSSAVLGTQPTISILQNLTGTQTYIMSVSSTGVFTITANVPSYPPPTWILT